MSSVSLAGSLEDLGLNDILQILSLSRKSGILRMNYKDQGLELFVKSGNVVAARPHPSISTLHRFFTDKRLLDEGKQAIFLSVLKNKAFKPEAWTKFWSATFRMGEPEIKRWAEGYIIWLVTRASRWNLGEFSFELDPSGSSYAKITKVPVFPSLEDGLSAEFLAIEGARITDEDNSRASAPDIGEQTITGAMPTDLAPSPDPEPAKGVQHLLFVDPKPESSERISAALRSRGFDHVATAESVDAAIDVIERSDDAGWTVVSELVMPKRDRSGVLGGLEVAQELTKLPKVSRVFLCSDLINEEIEAQGRDVGVMSFIDKPPRKAWKSNSDQALDKFVAAIATALGPPPQPEAPPVPESPKPSLDVSLDDPLAALMDEADIRVRVPRPKTDQGMHLLRHMIEELMNPNAEAEVSLLILRFAADFFQRSVFFAVANDGLLGLGQVGVTVRDPDLAIRSLKFPLSIDSAFRRVAQNRQSYLGPPFASEIHDALFARLGGPTPLEILVAPVLAGERIVAMLYADQVPTQTKIEGAETLEIFLAQAGLSLERAHLMRQIRELDRRA